ncbi:unnamed protein product, partial [marine sediment metagenome]
MKPILRLEDLYQTVKTGSTPVLSVAAGQDIETLSAVHRAVEENIIRAILVGDEKTIPP